MTAKQLTLSIIFGCLLLLFAIALFSTIKTIDEGERGVVTRWGEVHRTLEPGVNFVMPFADYVHRFEVRTQKYEVDAYSASRDLQSVQTTIALNFNVQSDSVGVLYTEVGNEYMTRIVFPAIQDTVKASTALFNAEALITRRAEVKDEIQTRLTERLATSYITVTDVSIVDFQFSPEFDKAIEAKVTAEQRALEAENKLKQVEFEAQQRIEQSKGEAEAIRIQAEAITQQGGKDYVNLQWIDAWKAGGANVPQTIIGEGGGSFIFNLGK